MVYIHYKSIVILLFSVLNHGFFTIGSRTLNLYLFSSTISHEAFTVAVAVHVTDSHVTICDTGFNCLLTDLSMVFLGPNCILIIFGPPLPLPHFKVMMYTMTTIKWQDQFFQFLSMSFIPSPF